MIYSVICFRNNSCQSFTKPTILQWPVCEEKKGHQGKEYAISHCFRLGRKGKDHKARNSRQEG